MKKMYVLIFALTFCFATIPFFASGAYKTAEFDRKAVPPEPDDGNYFLVSSASGEIIKVSDFDYVCSVVAAEMPILYEDEAIKAQAVAAYTYACRQRNSARKSGSECDISADSAKNQGYLTVDQMKERWGKKFNKYYARLKKLVGSVYGEQILYEGEPILAVYHAISGGQTESCAVIWGNDLPYLVPVDSEYDKSADGYKTTCALTADELKEKILARWPETIFPDDPAEWLVETQHSDSGTVTQIQIGSAKLTGAAVRRALSLRSAVFEANYTDKGFVFTVYGYGHGVGMSQTGANQMAKQGFDYKEILLHYYHGTHTEKLTNKT
ncbi:MAG: stage II sporulation protein D [Clostridia bacterium]|nr:stage II sporulation protein D [Clostridia bacterium]